MPFIGEIDGERAKQERRREGVIYRIPRGWGAGRYRLVQYRAGLYFVRA